MDPISNAEDKNLIQNILCRALYFKWVRTIPDYENEWFNFVKVGG